MALAAAMLVGDPKDRWVPEALLNHLASGDAGVCGQLMDKLKSAARKDAGKEVHMEGQQSKAILVKYMLCGKTYMYL